MGQAGTDLDRSSQESSRSNSFNLVPPTLSISCRSHSSARLHNYTTRHTRRSCSFTQPSSPCRPPSFSLVPSLINPSASKPPTVMPSPLRDWTFGSRNISESSDLLSNECSTPIRSSSPALHPRTPPNEPCLGSRAGYLVPTPSYTPSQETPQRSPLATPQATPSGHLGSPRFSMDPRSLSPSTVHRNGRVGRRLSNASLIRSRSVADPAPDDDDTGAIDRSRAMALIAVCTLSIGSHL